MSADMHKSFIQREQEINDDLTRKTEKSKQEANAIRIQSWWRGVMVRRFLGPFKKFKRKRGKKSRGGGKMRSGKKALRKKKN
jgi:hypothetical protein